MTNGPSWENEKDRKWWIDMKTKRKEGEKGKEAVDRERKD
jgi:hypothetical protein